MFQLKLAGQVYASLTGEQWNIHHNFRRPHRRTLPTPNFVAQQLAYRDSRRDRR